MANPEHIEILNQGVGVWNSWREQGGIYLTPDLRNADLIGADLVRANLVLTQFNGADLFKANINGANARGADFTRANLQHAHCNGTDLHGANFKDANLRSIDFGGANLSEARLDGANFYQARLYETIIGNTDLSAAKNLDGCDHVGPCILDYRTLIKSGNLPLTFLRGCGLPDALIDYIPSLLNDPLLFHSCFISYSSKDQGFANRLYSDLQNKGVRCWLASEDLKIGAEIRTGIDESIREHDKLLLVLSETSVRSQWVQQEVETALAKEREQGRTVLFPIRIDDAVMGINTGWPAYLKNTRNIGDFTLWKEHDSYQKAFERLLRDLKATGEPSNLTTGKENAQPFTEFEEIRANIILSTLAPDIAADLKQLKTFLHRNPYLLNRSDVWRFYSTWIAPYEIHLRYGASLDLKQVQYDEMKAQLAQINLQSPPSMDSK